MIGCSEGGTSIEDLAEKFPDKIVKIPVDVRKGLTDAQVKVEVVSACSSFVCRYACCSSLTVRNLFASLQRQQVHAAGILGVPIIRMLSAAIMI